jgi:hypothetical protein
MTAVTEASFPFADLALARRLERAEGRASREFVETRARLFPDRGACWTEVAGAYAMYDGVDSPITQTFGLGLFEKVTAAEMERLEAFFQERGAPVYHEVSPMAEPAVLALLNERGFQPFEFTSVLYRPINPELRLAASGNGRVRARLARGDEQELWARTSVEGWSEYRELAEQMAELMHVQSERPGALAFLAELDGKAIATGALCLHEGVALLAGASTIPEARKQGAQLALLKRRLRHAAEHGCDLAMMGALPGSVSQRNAERHGFRIAYTRIKWRRPANRS